jgi:hypothetical protein
MKVEQLLRGKERAGTGGRKLTEKKRTERGRRRGKMGQRERENTTKLSRPT